MDLPYDVRMHIYEMSKEGWVACPWKGYEWIREALELGDGN